MINIYDFLKTKKIVFADDKKALNWVRRLKAETLVRIGDSYFADEVELDRLLESYINQQIKQRKSLKARRATQARKNFNNKSDKLEFEKHLAGTEK